MNIVGNYYFNPSEVLGRGTFGTVYKGTHRVNPAVTVALKCVSKSKLGHIASIQSLNNEITILRSLRHGNIVTLNECIQTGNNVYLVMEFCNGGNFADYLKRKGKLQQDRIKGFFNQLASAMKELHSKKIVHRDLKPQNILLVLTTLSANPQYAEITLKIADFGVSRPLPQGCVAATFCGTPWYMAPEVLMSHAYDSKADLWSLGVIAYECLTGRVPFQGDISTLIQFYRNNVYIIADLPVNTSADLQSFLIGLLKRKPNERMNFETFFAHRFLR